MTRQHTRPNGSPRWTPEQDATLITLRSQGLSWTQISERMPPRSAKAIADHYQQLAAEGRAPATPSLRSQAAKVAALTRRFWTEEEDAELARLLSAGTGTRAIGEALARSQRSIQERIRHLGLMPEAEPKPKPPAPHTYSPAALWLRAMIHTRRAAA